MSGLSITVEDEASRTALDLLQMVAKELLPLGHNCNITADVLT